MPLSIVQLAPSDWQRYKKLRLLALQEDPFAFGSSYKDVASLNDDYWINRLKEAQKAESKWSLFAERDTQLVGMMTGNLHDQGIVQIHSVFVVPKVRRMGIASLLMKNLLERIKKNPLSKKAYVDVNKEQAAAIVLYKKFNFEIVDEALEPLGDGKYHPVLVICKVL